MTIKNYTIRWIGWKGDLFIWGDWRFNSGIPYVCWRIGPVIVKRWEVM